MAFFIPKSTKHRGYTDFCHKIGSNDANLTGILGKIRRNLLEKQPKLSLTRNYSATLSDNSVAKKAGMKGVPIKAR